MVCIAPYGKIHENMKGLAKHTLLDLREDNSISPQTRHAGVLLLQDSHEICLLELFSCAKHYTAHFENHLCNNRLTNWHLPPRTQTRNQDLTYLDQGAAKS